MDPNNKICHESMALKYVLHFVHEHIPFRWPEFLALASKNACRFQLISNSDHIRSRPFIVIELLDHSYKDSLIKTTRESFLLKSVYELWAESDISVANLAEEASKSPHCLGNKYAQPDQSFRVDCVTFGVSTSQIKKLEMIKNFTFFERFQCRPDLKNPRQKYGILEMNDMTSDKHNPKKTYYFGRELTSSDRKIVNKYSLRERAFIANTSMNPLLSFIAANTARVRPNDVVYDPFVGSGSLLVAAAHMGAYVMGADIDWQLLHGKSKPTRVGVKQREAGECVRANMKQYNLESRYLDVLVSDISRLPYKDGFRVDAIITDPPYGVRECSEKIGKRINYQEKRLKEGQVKYPSKVDYSIQDLIGDLLSFAAKHLRIDGRLIYYLPVTMVDGLDFSDYIPTHPCLDIISFSEQALTYRNYRLMIVMEKRKEPYQNCEVTIPDPVVMKNFRETYFNVDKLADQTGIK